MWLLWYKNVYDFPDTDAHEQIYTVYCTDMLYMHVERFSTMFQDSWHQSAKYVYSVSEILHTHVTNSISQELYSTFDAIVNMST